MNIICDGNSLYRAFLRSKKNSSWKPQVQRYELNYLTEIARTQRELMNRTYYTRPAAEFIISERGKTRAITGEQMYDRVVRHAICDNVLEPRLRKYLIYDNGSSLKDRGISFARSRIVTHLRKYYARHGSNDGYILLIDFSKYYDNIQHEIFHDQIREKVNDDFTLWLLGAILDSSKVDVSYMDAEQYAKCMSTRFNSLEYRKLDKQLLTGEKFMRKSLDIGDQVSQIAGIYYPHRIDDYVKIVRGEKYYARYMDDVAVVHENKQHLQELLQDITAIAADLGITINTKKTRICKISEAFRFLQISYALTDTGRVIQKIHPKRLTAMRHRLKKLHAKYERGQIAYPEIETMFRSWMGSHYKVMSRQQRSNINELFNQLFKEALHEKIQDNTGGRHSPQRSGTEWQQFHLCD